MRDYFQSLRLYTLAQRDGYVRRICDETILAWPCTLFHIFHRFVVFDARFHGVFFFSLVKFRIHRVNGSFSNLPFSSEWYLRKSARRFFSCIVLMIFLLTWSHRRSRYLRTFVNVFLYLMTSQRRRNILKLMRRILITRGMVVRRKQRSLCEKERIPVDGIIPGNTMHIVCAMAFQLTSKCVILNGTTESFARQPSASKKWITINWAIPLIWLMAAQLYDAPYHLWRCIDRARADWTSHRFLIICSKNVRKHGSGTSGIHCLD